MGTHGTFLFLNLHALPFSAALFPENILFWVSSTAGQTIHKEKFI